MSGLLLPHSVAQEIQKRRWAEQRAQRRELVNRLFEFDDRLCREWTPVLADLDPLLRMARARPQASEPGMNVRPGFYHLLRDDPSAPITVIPITGPDGESFAEPDSSLLEQLRAQDLQNPRVMERLLGQRAEREAAREREQHQDHLDRVDIAFDHYKTLTTASFGWRAPGKWTQNQAGRRGANRP